MAFNVLLKFSKILKRHLGLLVLTPLVLWYAPPATLWESETTPVSAHIVRNNPELPSRSVKLWRYLEDTTSGRAAVIESSDKIVLEFSSLPEKGTITMQADGNDDYVVVGLLPSGEQQELWRALSVHKGNLHTRVSPVVAIPHGVKTLEISSPTGEGTYALSWLAIAGPPLQSSLFLYLGACLGALLLAGILRLTFLAPLIDRVGGTLARYDALIAAVCCIALLTDTVRACALFCVLAAMLSIPIKLLSKIPLPATIFTLAILLSLPTIGGNLIQRRLEQLLAKHHRLDTDHRMIPFSEPDVNSDGVRFKGEASDITDQDFVVGFAGDSFTYGWKLKYEESYPYVLERLAKERVPEQKIKVVNLGWTSSSPLLSLRLLKELDNKYRMKALVYTIDMTDFDDDLRYEEILAAGKDIKPDPKEIFFRSLTSIAPFLENFPEIPALLSRVAGTTNSAEEFSTQGVARGCGGRFFITACGLEATTPNIERGVVKNLLAMNAWAAERGIKFAVTLAPRAYQYSDRESLHHYEMPEYTPLGPYVTEPFRYFEQRKATLPFPVFLPLDAFRNSSEFPLYFDDDPHWNPAGAALMAKATLEFLLSSGVLRANTSELPLAHP